MLYRLAVYFPAVSGQCALLGVRRLFTFSNACSADPAQAPDSASVRRKANPRQRTLSPKRDADAARTVATVATTTGEGGP